LPNKSWQQRKTCHSSDIFQSVNMSKRLRKYAPVLKLLDQSSPASRKRLLEDICSADFLQCMCDCAKNIIKGNVPLTPSQKRQLSRRKRLLKKLALKKTSQLNKRKIIQSGGFLGALLGPIISILGKVLGVGQ